MPTHPTDPIPPSDMDPRAAEPMPEQAPAQHDGQEEADSAVEDPLAQAHPHSR
ncbi:hypothetical protein SAMN05428989_2687 [Pseudoxanthomonas sp. GM95]|uniref:hypothetical protein n=1 Tax=Pseudoxanthomonas sp. GM95 TaxID=1881043 RepID=UPI0008C7084B|nr:hypothetical protein [Pseudoxanthomonas sp. GM95]SEL85236.1 hypothetical protein SAMN05428989_2687 [Pseudoxanthomonas sp. GM95]